eukprot:10781186-Alexandrium_andersonii.AAC.1
MPPGVRDVLAAGNAPSPACGQHADEVTPRSNAHSLNMSTHWHGLTPSTRVASACGSPMSAAFSTAT